MKRWVSWFVLSAGTVLVALALVLGALIVWVLPQHVGSVVIDGEPIVLGPAHAGHWLLASLAILLASAVVLVVVPLVAAAALLAPLLGVAIAALIVAAVFAVPLLPLALLGWWLWRRSRRRAAGVTIAA
ncbi:MAG TPA: hypothetical protein VFQ16_14895 [Burkholderiaceae bacterium]|nr:hypothetical protein [Burkholderiaceae bacterium]